jgi:hypothetical protein
VLSKYKYRVQEVSVQAGKLTGQVFLCVFITQPQSVNKLKCHNGGVIVSTRVVVSIDILELVIGVAASTQGKLVAKFNVQAEINVVHNPVVEQY